MPPLSAAPLALERDGAGPPLVLVHGVTQTGQSWRSVAGPLTRDYEVRTVDLPDHGASATRHATDLDDAAALLGATTGRASYVGYSLGGRVCLTLALAQPALVERLVLVGATPGIADDRERAARRAADDALAERIDPTNPGGARGMALEEFLDEWLAGPLFAHTQCKRGELSSTQRANTTAGLRAIAPHGRHRKSGF